MDIYVSDYDIEIEDSMMISGVTSKFQFLDHKGARPDRSPSEDKVLALSIFLDKGDEWQDTIDRLSSYELIDPANGEPHSEKLESESWTEDFGLTPKRYERLTRLVGAGARPIGSMRRRHMGAGTCLSLGLTLSGSDTDQLVNLSNLFFFGTQPSRYLKITFQDIFFSDIVDSEAPTIDAFRQTSAPLFLYSEPKLSLLSR